MMKHPTLNKIANTLFFAITIYLLTEPTASNWLVFDLLSLLSGNESKGISWYLLLALHWVLYMIILIHVKDIARYGSMKLAIQHSVETAKRDKRIKG